MFEYLIGVLVLAAAFTAIVAMLAIHYKLVADAAIDEEREKMKIRAHVEAMREYKRAIENTEYKIKYKPVEFINETDIDWGNDMEVQ